MKLRQKLVICLSLALPLSLAGCSDSTNLSSKGQLIECQVAADGTVGSCNPVSEPSHAAGTCVDRDKDGDDDPHDEAEDPNDDSPHATGTDDDDGDGQTNDVDDDDDNDGVDDADDCDELPGQDSDDGA